MVSLFFFLEDLIMRKLSLFSYPRPIDYKVSPAVFSYHSYSSWAKRELDLYILEHYWLSKEEAIESFRKEMDEYCCRAPTQNAKYMFSIAYDVATNILDRILEEGGDK